MRRKVISPPVYLKGKRLPGNKLIRSIRKRGKLINRKRRISQTPWGAIQNGGFENSTLAPWYGDGVLYTRRALVGNQSCRLIGGLNRSIAQYTLPLDTSRNYRLLFHMIRLSSAAVGDVFVSYSAGQNYSAEIPVTTIRLNRWRPVIFTIPVRSLGAQDPVIFIGLTNSSPTTVVLIDQVFLRPIIAIDPPVR